MGVTITYHLHCLPHNNMFYVQHQHMLTKSDHTSELASKLSCDNLQFSLKVFRYSGGATAVGNYGNHDLVLRWTARANWTEEIRDSMVCFNILRCYIVIYRDATL